MRIGYFGDGVWAHEALRRILGDSSLQVCFVCARYDTPDPVLKQLAKSANLPFLVTKNINSPEFIYQVKEMSCDIFVSMSFNQIFRGEILAIPPQRTINCHAGKLPFYRGRNILNWALINDEKEFGITVHYIDTGIDTGDIILQQTYSISESDDYRTLLEKAHVACPDILLKSIKLISAGGFCPKKQSELHPVGSYCSKRGVGDEILDWRQTSRQIYNFIRAICRPGPIARTYIHGSQSEVKINRAEMIPEATPYIGVPGAVLGTGAGFFLVKTNDTLIKVIEWDSERTIKTGDRLCQKPS